MKVTEGQKVTGKLRTRMQFGTTPVFIFPHGTVTEVRQDRFTVAYEGIRGKFIYREEDIDNTVYLRDELPGEVEEQQDYELERQRLGIEE